ncbi:hypothetical protein [Desulfatibacillum alkenivorans]|uniref:hypothetical protein n=1 Tax=Desulfatibacillum alkenivorans TaxID=259354 RepID=UPI00111489E3|nr:hypothetical protein [Desulfatibacillum alkenivorans]
MKTSEVKLSNLKETKKGNIQPEKKTPGFNKKREFYPSKNDFFDWRSFSYLQGGQGKSRRSIQQQPAERPSCRIPSRRKAASRGALA